MNVRSDSMKLFVSFLLLCGSLWPASLRADEPAISVTASSSVKYQPDMAEFTTSVSATEKDASKAAARVAELWTSLQQSLRSAGIPAPDASSISYSVNPEWVWNRTTGSRSLKGYTARHTVRVTVRDLGKLGGAIDAVSSAGASTIQGLRYSSSRYDQFRTEALAEAVRSAQRDAKVMARAAGGRIGGVLELSYSASRPVMPVMPMTAAAPQAKDSTNLQPGKQEVTVSVTSRWLFLSGKGK
ncbi:MAG TPA: DUF541 domain-containing protein [Chlorobaculum parvum]|uniref:DUF541 domain-containing protein n=1 Tax=Chlorobaculum parvum TaxID=274539 RepID=A0A7C5DCD4_9CHLB|nr:DUF541 domain-containing protein [Chlorobaculum parvum]